MQIYNKLVRDKIDEIINNNGKEEAIIRILSDDEYKLELLKKLTANLTLGTFIPVIPLPSSSRRVLIPSPHVMAPPSL